jgi:hypothetical protein
MVFNSTAAIGRPDMSATEFWKYQLDVTANRYYANHTYPTVYYESLKKISEYCKSNNIKLVFFIPASHVDLQKKTEEFNLLAEEGKFKEDIKKLGDVYDFNYPNEVTKNRANFSDPFHFNNAIVKTIIDELFNNRQRISIFSKCTGCSELK